MSKCSDIENMLEKWASWARSGLMSIGYKMQSLDATHAMSAYEYTISKNSIEHIQLKIKNEIELSENERTLYEYYKLNKLTKPTALGEQTNTGRKILRIESSRTADIVEEAMIKLREIDNEASQVVARYYIFCDSLSNIARKMNKTCKSKVNNKIYRVGDSKWAARKLKKATSKLDEIINFKKNEIIS